MNARSSHNYTGAVFSFLRVLSVALATALLPLLQGDQKLTLKAVGAAFGASFLLTVINFFREGETRFGPPPNPGAPDAVQAQSEELPPDDPATPVVVADGPLDLRDVPPNAL